MKKVYSLGLAAIFTAAMVSCNNDELLTEQNTVLDKDMSFFVNIDISNVSESTPNAFVKTREGGGLGKYENGWNPDDEPNYDKGDDTKNENTVKTIFLIFYDNEGKRVYTTQVSKDNNSGFVDTGLPASQNSLYKGIVQVDVKHGSKKPSYVMCFINPITSQSFEMNPEFETLQSLQATTRPRIIDDNGYFAMSKSVYFGANRSKAGYNPAWDNDPEHFEKIVATPIPDGKLFATPELAKDAVDKDNEDVINIYVERYAAKVNFSIQDNANMKWDLVKGSGEDGEDGKIEIEFVPEYWAVNAYESDTYICKSFLSPDMTTDLSYKAMNGALSESSSEGTAMPWFWNNPTAHRCYWAQTPAYYKKAYPRVADDILDQEVSGDNADFALGYYSYDDLVANAKTKQSIIRKARNISPAYSGSDKGWPIYARENTVSGEALRNAATDPMASAKAAVASVVLVGHYKINGVDMSEKVYSDGTPKTFYVMGNKVNGYTYFEDAEKLMPYLVNTTVHFAKDSKGEETFFNYGIEGYEFTDNNYEKYFVIKHPDYNVRKYSLGTTDALVIDSRFVTIQLDKEKVLAEGASPLYAYIGGVYTVVTEENIDMINQQMLYQAGTVQGFQGGKAYFTIPIQHLGYYRSSNTNYSAGKTANDKDFDWTVVRSGDFGLVRNHTYSINVTEIQGLGNGIPDPSTPIVPPTDPEEYYIGARLIVLNWAIVPEQNVKL